MKSFKLRITTPAGTRYDDEALQLSLRVLEGDIAIMAGHIPFVSAVVAGKCKVYTLDGDVRGAVSSSGLLTVSSDGVSLLCSEFDFE